LHSLHRMDMKNLISRIELAAALHVHPATIAAWTRRGLFPEPKECLSDRVILYDRDEVRRALDQRKAARRQRIAPRRRSA
jgi:DNA-binding transcriptional MerR regulator